MTMGERWGALLAIPGIVLAVSSGARAQSCEPAAAKVVSVQGDVDVSDSDRVHWRDAQLNQVLCAGQQVRLMAKSRAVLLLPNETLIHLDEGSVFTLRAIEPDKPPWLDLLRGALHVISRVPRALNIRTPFVNAGIEGTEFALRVDPARAELWVYEGRVRFSNRLGQLLIASGEAAAAAPGRAPERRIVIKPRRAVEWALYYPPLLDSRPEAYPEVLRPAVLAYRRNDLTAAFARLEALPPEDQTGRFFTLRAGFLLSVGRVAEAERDLTAALKDNPKDGTALALRAVIAVVRNETDEALRLAQEAVTAEPRSPTPYVARSYAEQSAFEIEKAHQSLQQASRLAPEEALVWARLSDINLSLGDLDAALEAARKAEQLDPGLSRTQSVLGFAYLTRIEVDRAKSAFERAMALDPADPLPRLGLGLAKIRDGDLDAGTEEIEIAASLDPNNSLVRSYLGKAYYDQKRGGLASTEYEQAKLLDPKDPTPWFYDAFQKQTTNRPVEALHDLQRSIELNNNRAVYRSKLLLDQDLAAREAALGSIYRDVGFGQLGLVEGWKSLVVDPGNYSAHRLLSDSYSALPRHEIARVSELLQSQLLQPLNIRPVQPQLSVRNLDTLSGVGPAEAAFNEFTPLFERNRPLLNVSGVVGNNETYADEAVLSGIYDRVSYSFGQYYYSSSGFRPKNDVRHNVYDLFTQAALSTKVNVQFEYRNRDTEQEDLRLELDPDFEPEEKRSLDHETARVGLHVSPSPRSDIVASVIYSNREETVETENPISISDRVDDEREGYEGEAQYLIRWDRANLIVGGGAYDVDNQTGTRTTTTDPSKFPPVVCSIFPQLCVPTTTTATARDKGSIAGYNSYVYSNVRFPTQVVWTLGLSYDSYEETIGRLERGTINPKVGLQWDITERIRLRTAYFQTLKRLLALDQTIEPTQVAGFNQFYDDPNGTHTQAYGAALDTVLAEAFYGGAEFFRRELVRPTLGTNSDPIFNDQLEDRYRTYLYWTPHTQWALSAGYQHEHYSGSALQLDTDTVPLGVGYFHPHGFFAEFDSTFVWQDKGGTKPAAEEFTSIDAAIGYRFPKRFGIISLEARNLLDEEFLYQDLNSITSDQFGVQRPFIPDRTVILRLTLNF